MQGRRTHDAPYYRCRFPAEYALANTVSHRSNIYVREDAFSEQIHRWVARLFGNRLAITAC